MAPLSGPTAVFRNTLQYYSSETTNKSQEEGLRNVNRASVRAAYFLL